MSVQDHVHRARLYKLVSLAFDRPTDPVADAMSTGEFDDQLLESAAAIDDSQLREDAESVAAESPNTEAEIDDYYSSWARLFGFEKGGEIQQYEIEYAPGTLVTSTNDLADIAGFYRAFDLSLEDGNRERVDHLCIELEFVSHLALQTAYLTETEDETGQEVLLNAQRDFIEDHLGRWHIRFRETVNEESDDEFYGTLADLLVSLVETDIEWLDIEPEQFQETPPSPLEGFSESDGDFRCGTCGSMSSPEPPEIPTERSQNDHR